MASTSGYNKPKRQHRRPSRLDDMWVQPIKEEREAKVPADDEDADKDWEAGNASSPDSQGSGSPHSSSMSLDVLAQVATETLKREPSRAKKKPLRAASKRRILTARGVSSMETLTLEQIRMLSDTSLVNMFAENKADELRRVFCYTCRLMPSECDAVFSSFGNESRARQQVRNHLLGHIGELLQESCSANGESKKFTAEPLHARQKRLAREKAATQKKKKPSPKAASRSKYPGFTVIRERNPPSQSSMEDVIVSSSGRILGTASVSHSTDKTATTESSPVAKDKHEQTIIDLLSRSQPFLDHNYTTVFGKRYNPEFEESEENAGMPQGSKQGDAMTDKTVTLRVSANLGNNINSVHIPVIRLSQLPQGADNKEMNGESLLISTSEIEQMSSSQRMGLGGLNSPYPPMPKSDPAHKAKVVIPEEEMSSDEDCPKAAAMTHLVPTRIRKKRVGTTEEERKLALKYIRELRYKAKPTEAVTLVCKICKDKTFTATATLMYHYRSHAGIKPFVCLICNTTFTRQHSLNYHMLIHNNQSRFTCKECGRKFRHPSHFKEHLRRHTGETPFHCLECPLRFKTRNTYKRHLKTRHNKTLTSNGVPIGLEEAKQMGVDEQASEDSV